MDTTAPGDDAHAWRMTISGTLDLNAAEEFDAAFQQLVDRGARLVVLDLRSVEFLDSSGLRSIVLASSSLADRGGRLTVSGLSGAAERVLELTGVLEQLRRGEHEAD